MKDLPVTLFVLAVELPWIDWDKLIFNFLSIFFLHGPLCQICSSLDFCVSFLTPESLHLTETSRFSLPRQLGKERGASRTHFKSWVNWLCGRCLNWLNCWLMSPGALPRSFICRGWSDGCFPFHLATNVPFVARGLSYSTCFVVFLHRGATPGCGDTLNLQLTYGISCSVQSLGFSVAILNMWYLNYYWKDLWLLKVRNQPSKLH